MAKKEEIKDENYKKYKGVYTKYAIYIDNHIPDIAIPYQNPDIENTICRYIESICYVLAYKKKFFNNVKDYREFSQYAAGEFFNIFRDRYNHQGEMRRGKLVKPIKSSLNFIKSILYDLSVEYSKRYFYQVFKSDWGEEEDNKNRKEVEEKKRIAVESYTKNTLIDDYNEDLVDTVIQTCKSLPSIIKKVLSNSPYNKDKLVMNRLYKTCLLSLLNNFTMPKTKKNTSDLDATRLSKRYGKEKDNCIILWHLDESFKPQVGILLSRIREKLASEIEGDKQYFTLDDNTINNILSTAYNTYDMDQSGEYND
jgi:hypothetical protein